MTNLSVHGLSQITNARIIRTWWGGGGGGGRGVRQPLSLQQNLPLVVRSLFHSSPLTEGLEQAIHEHNPLHSFVFFLLKFSTYRTQTTSNTSSTRYSTT